MMRGDQGLRLRLEPGADDDQKGRGYLPPRPFLFGGLGQPPLGGGFLSAFPTFSSHLPGRTGVSGFGPRFRGGFPFDLAPIGPPSAYGVDGIGWPGHPARRGTRRSSAERTITASMCQTHSEASEADAQAVAR